MTDMTHEHWVSVPDYAGIYEVSNFGQVRSLDRDIVSSKGQRYTLPGKLLKPQLDSHGYYRVSFSKNSNVSFRYIHQLVLTVFDRPKHTGDEGRHLDGNPLNNRRDNLAWGTKAENMADAKRHGTFPLLERRPGAKLAGEDAAAIFVSNEARAVVAKRYGVGVGVIHQIRNRITWASVTEGLTLGENITPRCEWLKSVSDDVLFDKTKSRCEIAALLGVSVNQLKNMRRVRRDRIATGK